AEWRFARDYRIGKRSHTLAAGLRAYSGSTERRQLGIGDSGESYGLDIESLNNGKEWGRDLEFGTQNAAVFLENLFRLGSHFQLTPGMRYEYVKSTANGYINTSAQGGISSQSQSRNILLFGLGAEYHLPLNTELYANFSQAYRPVTYSELTPSAVSDQIDPDLEDAKGFNIDLGYRGRIGEYLNFDIGAFYLFYDGRIGSILKDSAVFRTNIGTSVSKGFEGFVEFHPVRLWMPDSRWGFINLFVNYSYIDARYTKWDDPAQLSNPSKTLVNKRVEYAPRMILRCGINYRIQKLSISAQLNAVGETYADALNTESPNTAATIGKLDPYQVLDLNLSFSFRKHYQLKAGINNLLDERYATRRAGGYPGPGLMPANGRTSFVSLGVSF
ncbi:MAG TPA: TonB-dependent receptor, partial [Saprospiraceae bacterium]|nr:TonB-dependent receptor [Saprospiraceae bacterium]